MISLCGRSWVAVVSLDDVRGTRIPENEWRGEAGCVNGYE